MASSSLRRSPCESPAPARRLAGHTDPSEQRVDDAAPRPGGRTARGCEGAPREAWRASWTFSAAGSPSKRAEVWNDRASPRRARRVADRLVTSWPPRRTDPSSGGHPREDVDERGLARPVGADDAEQLTGRDVRETSSRIWAPPTFQPMASAATADATGTGWSLERRAGGATAAGSRVSTSCVTIRALLLERGGEHRLQQGVVLGADLQAPLGPSNFQPSRAATMARRRRRLAERWTIIWAATKPSLVNRSTVPPCLLQAVVERLVGGVVGGAVEEVREEVDLVAGLAEDRVGWLDVETGHDLGRRRRRPAARASSTLGGVRAGPGDEEQVRGRALDLRGERRQVGRGRGDLDRVDRRALPAEDRGDGGDRWPCRRRCPARGR